MGANKKRLYLALYPSGSASGKEELRYHWSFLVGPKIEEGVCVPGMRYHVKDPLRQGWKYEACKVKDIRCTVNLLARIVIAKIEDEERLIEIFKSTPVNGDDKEFNCRTWVKDAVNRLADDGKAVGTAVLDWDELEKRSREYVVEKHKGGRYDEGQDMTQPKPTWDLLENKELIS
ncbi:hypothetical protein M426DRAFT_16064 [Hypoxylon sp. CI-4A]|nr:hypothetical protein M426DRAFT_16064 [Hypoxylon sp. CI-4A]